MSGVCTLPIQTLTLDPNAKTALETQCVVQRTAPVHLPVD